MCVGRRVHGDDFIYRYLYIIDNDVMMSGRLAKVEFPSFGATT